MAKVCDTWSREIPKYRLCKENHHLWNRVFHFNAPQKIIPPLFSTQLHLIYPLMYNLIVTAHESFSALNNINGKYENQDMFSGQKSSTKSQRNLHFSVYLLGSNITSNLIQDIHFSPGGNCDPEILILRKHSGMKKKVKEVRNPKIEC